MIEDFDEQKHRNKVGFEKFMTYVEENPLEAMFDFEEDPSLRFITIVLGHQFIQMDARIARLVMLLQTRPEHGMLELLESVPYCSRIMDWGSTRLENRLPQIIVFYGNKLQYSF